jgi:uncharacterized protein YkwD
MNGKIFIHLIMLTAVLLSACGSQSSAGGTVTPTVAETTAVPATNTTAPEATATTEAPVTTEATVEAPPTPQATRPPNAPDCTNNAAFVADVTIPDNSEVVGGTVFTKTWRIMNTGTCSWAADYTLTHYSEERMEAPASVPLPLTLPGQTADISVELAAPNTIGIHRANFVIKNPTGLIMKINDDSRLWLIINVKTTSAATAAPTTQATQVVGASPTTASSSSGTGLVNATCGYAIDQGKLIELLNAVNAYRSQSSMFAYTVNPKLAQAAQAHAGDMACNQVTAHTGSNGTNVAQRVAASGYVAAYVDENVNISSPVRTGQEVVDLWVNDQADTHSRLNLVSDTYIEIGIGYVSFNNSGYYVIVFASP